MWFSSHRSANKSTYYILDRLRGALADLMQVKPEKERDVAKFTNGDRVKVPSGTRKVPLYLLGASGTIVRQYGYASTGKRLDDSEPLGSIEPQYEVQFDGREGIDWVDESWVEHV